MSSHERKKGSISRKTHRFEHRTDFEHFKMDVKVEIPDYMDFLWDKFVEDVKQNPYYRTWDGRFVRPSLAHRPDWDKKIEVIDLRNYERFKTDFQGLRQLTPLEVLAEMAE